MDDAATRAPKTDEAARLRALRALRALDSGSDSRFDRIARMAALILRAPRAAVVLVDQDRLWHKARIGIPAGEYPRAGSVADLMIQIGRTVFSPDMIVDPRFASLNSRPNQVDVRFYAGAPLIAPGGEVIGVLSVGDPEPHAAHTPDEQQSLEDLAALAMEMLVHDAENIDAERRARLDQRRVELALDAAGLGEFEWDIAQDQVFVSERLKALTGVTADSAAGKGGEVSFRFVHPDDAAQLREVVENGLRGEGLYLAVYLMMLPDDGRLRLMQGACVVVYDR
ncbi:MAG: GAF domain-containing protein, partial [Caulobacterales bacterium]|nr:GAF domain-containing protein [Caulobacterales bacterium]